MRIRIKFTKNNSVKYLGHLDIMRSFQKIFNRANIKMVYSEGFNPHQKMSFALPLGVSIESQGEYFDAEVADGQNPADIREALDKAAGPGFDILAVKELPEVFEKCMAAVKYASYDIIFDEETELNLEKYLSQNEILIEKTTKSGTKLLDIKPMVVSMSYENKTLSMLMKAGSEENIKPELVTADIFRYNKLDFSKDRIRIIRTNLYAEGIIPLIDYQTL